MNKKPERIAVFIIIVLAIAIVGIAIYELMYAPSSQTGSTTTNSFFSEPVVEIIIPSLFRNTPTGGVNTPLNVTRGESVSLSVEVFPTVSLNLTMRFRVFLLSSGQFSSSTTNQNESGTIMATFHPQNLSVIGGGKGNTIMSIDVSVDTQVGEYNSILSAVNLTNSSEFWGDIFQLNVIQ